MAYRNKRTGEIISDEEAQQRGIQPSVSNLNTSSQVDSQPKVNFMERLKLGFGGAGAKEKQQQLERESGLKGEPDIGDIADVVGSSLPIVGGILGAIGGGGLIGGAAGASIGKSIQVSTGKLLGVRENESKISEIIAPIKEAAYTYLGGKILQKAVVPLAVRAWSIVTGQSDDIARAIFQNPDIADKTLKTGVDKTLRETVAKGSDASVKIRTEFINKFSTVIDKIFKGQKKSIAIPKDLMDGLDDLIRNKGVKATEKGLDFSVSEIAARPGEATKIQSVYKIINEWKDYTPKGLIEFKRLVGKFIKFPKEGGGVSKSPILGQYYHFIDSLIKERVPKNISKAYSLADKTFSEKIALYDDIVDAFNSGDPFKRLAGLFSKNQDTLRELIKFFEAQSGKKVFPVVATREMSLPGTQAIFNPRTYVDWLVSPKIQTILNILAGKAYRSIPIAGKKMIEQGIIQSTTSPILKTVGDSILNKYEQ